MKLISIAAAVSILAIAAAAEARPGGGWRVIGTRTVAAGVDTDRIATPGDRLDNQLRLCVFDAPLRMIDLDISFASGQRHDVKIRNRLAPGSCSRVINLPWRGRSVTAVELRYERLQPGAVPRVEVLAR